VTSEGAAEPHLYIWGTDVNIADTKKKFLDFLKNFVDDLPGGIGSSELALDNVTPYYMARLEEVRGSWRFGLVP
jgi:hypothetical protein